MNLACARPVARVLTWLILTLLANGAHADVPTSAPATTQTTRPAVSIEMHFSPQEEIAQPIVKLIDQAQHSLDVAAFSFTQRDIADAIMRAHRRGLEVRFVMDYTQSRLKYCLADDLIDAGIDVRTRHRRGFQHNKYILIDESIVITGSYNFTKSADERNTENLLVIRNAPEVAKAFLADYERIHGDTLRGTPKSRRESK